MSFCENSSSGSGSGSSSNPKSVSDTASASRISTENYTNGYIPSPDSLSVSSCNMSSPLETPDMKSSSESILVLVLVLVDGSGVGGFGSLAEANLLLFRVPFEDSMASAFLFFSWEEMMSK